MSRRDRGRALILPGIVALAAFAVLIALGTWQIERKHWKETLIETLARRTATTPVALPPKEEWPTLSAASDEFRRVTFRAEFIHTQEALIYTVGSALRPDVSGPGYWVFTPARLPDRSIVMVNRGFIPTDRLDTHLRGEGQVLDAVDVVGALRWPEARGWFTPKHVRHSNIWYLRDHLAIATAKDLGDVAPFYVDQEGPPPPGGLPRVGPLSVQLRNDHMQYALTWYGLAAVLVAVFAIWARGRWRRY